MFVPYISFDPQVHQVTGMKKLRYPVRQRFTHRTHTFYDHVYNCGHGDQPQTVSVVNDYKKTNMYIYIGIFQRFILIRIWLYLLCSLYTIYLNMYVQCTMHIKYIIYVYIVKSQWTYTHLFARKHISDYNIFLI